MKKVAVKGAAAALYLLASSGLLFGMELYVGNLSFNTTRETLESAFAHYGHVTCVGIVKDQATGRSRGFAFVTMPDDHAAQSAINGLNASVLDGRTLTVNEARPKSPRSTTPDVSTCASITSQDAKGAKDKSSKDKSSKDKISKDKSSKDKISKDKSSKDTGTKQP